MRRQGVSTIQKQKTKPCQQLNPTALIFSANRPNPTLYTSLQCAAFKSKLRPEAAVAKTHDSCVYQHKIRDLVRQKVGHQKPCESCRFTIGTNNGFNKKQKSKNGSFLFIYIYINDGCVVRMIRNLYHLCAAL